MGAVALEAPAEAQRKKKEEAAAPKANYSKKFVEAYKPVEDLSKAGDAAGAKAQLPAVIAAAETPDDKSAAGGLVYNIGTQTSDTALQRQGLDLMIASGRADATKLGQYNLLPTSSPARATISMRLVAISKPPLLRTTVSTVRSTMAPLAGSGRTICAR